MARNVIIFSDGTGQVGGYAFDEDLHQRIQAFSCNASFPGFMHSIRTSKSPFMIRAWVREVRADFSLVASRAGFTTKSVRQPGLGITQNIIDCYAALIRLAKPEDRIFFFGFSRGAYTVRSAAAVVPLCGIPTRNLVWGQASSG